MTSAIALEPITPVRVAAAQAEHSAGTLAAYRSAWAAWTKWADAHDATTLPAEPAAVAAYLTHRAEGFRMPTVRMAAAAIAAAHRAAGHDNPVLHALVKATLKGLERQAAAGTAPARQARALTDEALAAIRVNACKPRRTASGRMESPGRARRRGLVDIALCQVMSDAGLRRSEAAALVWADVERQPNGSGRLLIRRPKTDAAGPGAVVVVTAQALRDLAAIRQGAPANAPMFGLSAVQITRRIKAAARAAGLGDGFGGHSGRVGLARRMMQNGAPMQTAMLQGRWKSSGMVTRYTRNEGDAAALPYL